MRTRNADTRWRRMPGGRALAALFAAMLVLAACGDDDPADTEAPPDEETEDTEQAEAAPDPDPDDTELRIRTVMDITSLDPNVMPSTTDDAVAMTIMEGLVAYEPGGSGELINVLAEQIELSDDGLTLDFTLREGVQFHGGYGELTAEDVKFSFERIAGLIEDVDTSYGSDWATLEEVEVTDTYSGTIHLSEPFAPLMINTLPGNAGLIVSQAAVEELGDDFGTNPIGTGPYQWVDWNPGQEIIVERFDDYHGAMFEYLDEPQWQRIVWVPIEDDSAADIAIETGDVDMGQVSTGSVERFEADDNFIVNPLATFDYGWIGMNVQDEILSDVNVRRAIRQALDIDAMITAGFDGQVARAHALVSPEMPIGYWEDAPVYEPDVEQARAHLDEAGVDELTLSMIIDGQVGSREIAEIAQANLAEIGITLEIDLLDGGEYREIARDANQQLFYISFSNTADPSWATVWFNCDQVGDWNYQHWCNEEFQQLHEDALVETDPDERHDMYVRMQEIMDEDAIAAWVMYRTNLYTYRSDMEISLVPERYGKYLAYDFRR
jgi:peptide/nickel transport system substrate-binding protein